MSSQKTTYQRVNSYWVMNRLGDNSIHTAEPSDPIKNTRALAQRTSQIMEYEQDVIIQMGTDTRCSR